MFRILASAALLALAAGACSPDQVGKPKDAGPKDDVPDKDAPPEKPPLTEDAVRRLGLGGSHTCWLAESGGVWCWGSNNLGQLGDGTTVDRAEPGKVLDLDGPVAVTARSSQSCARVSSGLLRCWGLNSLDQLGSGSNSNERQTPVTVLDIDDAEDAAMGALHGCALREDGNVWCWGSNMWGALGRGTAGSPEPPGPVTGLDDAVQVASGTSFACAVRGDGSVACWGRNANGQLGDGTTTDRSTPGAVVGLAGTATWVATGANHACALLTTGAVACWGANGEGQVGTGTAGDAPVLTPTEVMGAGSGIAAIDAAANTTCALRSTGALACWGSNATKQLGAVAEAYRATAADVVGVADVAFFGVGSGHVCAAASGTVFCWGSNTQGQLGFDGVEGEVATPTPVPFPDDPI